MVWKPARPSTRASPRRTSASSSALSTAALTAQAEESQTWNAREEMRLLDAVEQFGPVFVQIYGQGECPMAITALSRDDVADRSSPGWQARLASVGRAQSAVEVQIGDAEGRPLPAGEQGEVMVRGAAYEIVRPRPTYASLIALDRLPDWLLIDERTGKKS